MSVDDQSDVYREIRELRRKVARLESTSMLENASITHGRVRFIGGTLRVDSGGTVSIEGFFNLIGTALIQGPVTITGSLDITGPTEITGRLDVNGPWYLAGDGDITGDVDLAGSLDVVGGGNITVGDVLIDPQNGGRVVVDDGGRIVVRASETGQPDLRLIQGRVRFGNAFIEGAQNGNTINMSGPPNAQNLPALVTVTANHAEIRFAGASGGMVRALADGVQLDGVRTSLPSGVTAQYLALGSDGYMYALSGTGGGGDGTPGPIAGDFMWPFDPSTTHPVLGVYGMRLNPVTGQWAMHNGQDFSVPGGSPIPSAGDGQVSAKGFDSGRGNYIVIDHGGGVQTHYFHMQAGSPLAVGANVDMGDIIGAVGTTGSSTGNHLHWEVHVNGATVDPAVFMAAQGWSQ